MTSVFIAWCLCWQGRCKIYVADLHSPNRCMSALHWKEAFWGLHLQCECKGIKQEQSSHYKAHCHHWPANQRHFYAGLQCIILCQRIGLIGTKPDTFVAKKMPRLGGPKMWDHVNRPPVGLSLLFQYHSCQGPCTRWHSLSRREKMFQFRLGGEKKKNKHKTQGLWQVSALTNPEKRGVPKCSFNCGTSIKASKWGRLGGNLGTSDRHS